MISYVIVVVVVVVFMLTLLFARISATATTRTNNRQIDVNHVMLQQRTNSSVVKSNAVVSVGRIHLLDTADNQTKPTASRVAPTDDCLTVTGTTTGITPDCDTGTTALSAIDRPVTVTMDPPRREEDEFRSQYRNEIPLEVDENEINFLVDQLFIDDFNIVNENEVENRVYRYPVIYERSLEPSNWNPRLFFRYTGRINNDQVNYSVPNDIMRILEENFRHMHLQHTLNGNSDSDIATLTQHSWEFRMNNDSMTAPEQNGFVPMAYNCRYAFRLMEHLSNNYLTVASLRRLRYNIFPSDEAFKWLTMTLAMAVNHPHPKDINVDEDNSGQSRPQWTFPGPSAVDRAVRVLLGPRGLIHGFNAKVPDFVQESLVMKNIYWPRQWSTYTDTDGDSSRRLDSPGMGYTDSDVNGETGPIGISRFGITGSTTVSQTSSCITGDTVPISRFDMFYIPRRKVEEAYRLRRFDKYVRLEHRERRQRREIRRARRLERLQFDEQRRNDDVAYDAEAVRAEKLACHMTRMRILALNRAEAQRQHRESLNRNTRKNERKNRREQISNQPKVEESCVDGGIPIRTPEEYRFIHLGNVIKNQVSTAWKLSGGDKSTTFNNHSEFHCWITPVRWIRQNGPNCGLAVLAMALRPLMTCEVEVGGGTNGGSDDPEGRERTVELQDRMLHTIKTNQENYFVENSLYKNEGYNESLFITPLTLLDLQVMAMNNMVSNYGEMFSARAMYQLGNLGQSNRYNVQLVECDLLTNFKKDQEDDELDIKSEPIDDEEDTKIDIIEDTYAADLEIKNEEENIETVAEVEEEQVNESNDEIEHMFDIRPITEWNDGQNLQQLDEGHDFNEWDDAFNIDHPNHHGHQELSDHYIDNFAESDNETLINGVGRNYANFRNLCIKNIVNIPNTPSLPLNIVKCLIRRRQTAYNYPEELNVANSAMNHINNDDSSYQQTSNDSRSMNLTIDNSLEEPSLSTLNIVQRLISGQLIAICFDCDKNMRPSDKNFGEAAHWALLCGVIVERPCVKDEVLDRNYDGSDLDLEQDADRVWVVARHGKSSGRYSVWSLRELANSNRQLLRPNQMIMDTIPKKVRDMWEHDHTVNQLDFRSSGDEDTDDDYDDFPANTIEGDHVVMTDDDEMAREGEWSAGGEGLAEHPTLATPSVSFRGSSPPPPPPPPPPPSPPTPPPMPSPPATAWTLRNARWNRKSKPFILPDGPRLDLCLAKRFIAFEPIQPTHFRLDDRFRTDKQPRPSPLSNLLYHFKIDNVLPNSSEAASAETETNPPTSTDSADGDITDHPVFHSEDNDQGEPGVSNHNYTNQMSDRELELSRASTASLSDSEIEQPLLAAEPQSSTSDQYTVTTERLQQMEMEMDPRNKWCMYDVSQRAASPDHVSGAKWARMDEMMKQESASSSDSSEPETPQSSRRITRSTNVGYAMVGQKRRIRSANQPPSAHVAQQPRQSQSVNGVQEAAAARGSPARARFANVAGANRTSSMRTRSMGNVEMTWSVRRSVGKTASRAAGNNRAAVFSRRRTRSMSRRYSTRMMNQIITRRSSIRRYTRSSIVARLRSRSLTLA